MIVSRIDGGLGNQLFQVAYGLQLAHHHQVELVLDVSSYVHQPAHGLQIQNFKIPARSLTPVEQHALVPHRYRPEDGGTSGTNQRRHFVGWMKQLLPPALLERLDTGVLHRVREKPFGFAARYLQVPDNSYLAGYWQSEQFFPDVRAEVRKQFQLREPLSAASQRIAERLHDLPSLAVHVRRGDYVSSAQAAAIYRHLSPEYYRRAVMARLTERTGVEVFLFSNDIAWCKTHIKLPCPVHFVTDTAGPYEDLSLMTAAESIVIANSTFSWWGAWLSTQVEPRVFSPASWFHPGTLNDSHMTCLGWTKIDDPQVQRSAA